MSTAIRVRATQTTPLPLEITHRIVWLPNKKVWQIVEAKSGNPFGREFPSYQDAVDLCAQLKLRHGFSAA